MVVTIYIACVLIAVMNTWYLTTQLKFKKELAASGGSHKQLKETRISIVICMLIYLVNILFAAITTSVTRENRLQRKARCIPLFLDDY
ncbi:TPA: hypothetical protein J1302_002264 [Escherichia coli]|nr:hypothetical protein [Escherichia coli]